MNFVGDFLLELFIRVTPSKNEVVASVVSRQYPKAERVPSVAVRTSSLKKEPDSEVEWANSIQLPVEAIMRLLIGPFKQKKNTDRMRHQQRRLHEH